MTSPDQEEMLLGDLLATLRDDWLTLLVSVCLAAAGAVGLALWLPDRYESEAVLANASTDKDGLEAVADRLGNLGGLAALALPGSGSDREETIALAILQSRAFVTSFIDRHDLLPAIMAAEKWEEEEKRLILDSKRYDAQARQWRPETDGRDGKPSPQAAYRIFESDYEISEDPRTGLLTVLMRHESPVLAKQMVEWVVEDINAQMRDRAIAEAQRSIRYLKEEIATNSLKDLESMLYRLVQSQTERLVLARARPEYAFRVIDPPVIPEQPSTPRRKLIVLVGIVLGIALGSGISLFRRFTLPRLRATRQPIA